jgi:hypothetical protein
MFESPTSTSSKELPDNITTPKTTSKALKLIQTVKSAPATPYVKKTSSEVFPASVIVPVQKQKPVESFNTGSPNAVGFFGNFMAAESQESGSAGSELQTWNPKEAPKIYHIEDSNCVQVKGESRGFF